MDYRVIYEPAIVDEDRSVLIMIHSAPGYLHKRNEIRTAWGVWPRARVIFFMGVSANNSEEQQGSIEKEVSDYGDLVQMNFTDTYRNLTLKICSLVMWAKNNTWPERKLVIKMDDDVCVDMPLLTSILEDFKEGVYGLYRDNAVPFRCYSRSGCSKWELTRQEYGEDSFPPHVPGSFVVITESALNALYDKLFVPPFIFIDDVYLFGLVTRAAGVPVQAMPKGTRINQDWPGEKWREQENVVAQHNCSGRQREFWRYSLRSRKHHET